MNRTPKTGKTRHEYLVDALLLHDPRIKKARFRASLFAALHGERMKTADPELRAMFDHGVPGFIPDAFMIDHEDKAVCCYEVSVTSKLESQKAARYCDLFWYVDNTEWDLVIIDVDEHGAMRALDPFATSQRKQRRAVFGPVLAELTIVEHAT